MSDSPLDILSILGSPREQGNTAYVLNWVEHALRANGHQVERINLIEYHIEPCVECLECRHEDHCLCANDRDDANGLIDRLVRADAIVIATPVFCWGFPSHLKALMDRMYCTVGDYDTNPDYTSMLCGKPIGLVVTAGGAEEDNAELLIRAFNAMVQFLKATSAGHLLYPFFRGAAHLTDHDRERAEEFAESMLSVAQKA